MRAFFRIFFEKPFVVPALVLGIAFLFGTVFIARTLVRIRSFEQTIAVTGSARKLVTSDSVKWTSNIMRTVKLSALDQGYKQLANDLVAVKSFLIAKGINEKEVTITPISMEELYKPDFEGEKNMTYTLRQVITVSGSDVQKVTGVANAIQDLISKGVLFSTQSLEYYYSKIPELRVELLADAVRDAKIRAKKLAENSGAEVGYLKSAASGVVQVLAPNSVDVSDYGSYDVWSIEKEVMVSVRASFAIE